MAPSRAASIDFSSAVRPSRPRAAMASNKFETTEAFGLTVRTVILLRAAAVIE
jgi:hypothetical protein